MKFVTIAILFAASHASAGNCETFGYSGKTAHTKSCVNVPPDQRTIECMPGFAVSGTKLPTITLRGSVAFAGCAVSDPCAAFGYSGKTEHTQSCVNNASDSRTITCLNGFLVDGTTSPTITLRGDTAFRGCVANTLDMCKRYGYSNRPANVKECVNGTNERTITCMAGYVVV